MKHKSSSGGAVRSSKRPSSPPSLSGQPDAAFHQILTSTERNFDLPAWSLDGRLTGCKHTRSYSVTKHRLHGGRQEGVDLIRVENGALSLTVIPTRGMGILSVESEGLRLGWNSPVKEVVHPHFIQLQSRNGLGWLEGFNEWLVRCGLEFAGAPGPDEFVTNTGARAKMDLTLHGKIANTPASQVELIIESVPPYTLRLRGRVDEFMFYGPKLELWTEISLQPNSTSFFVQDTIVNRGGADQEFEVIYHVNFGAPLLEAGAEFVGAVQRMRPMNEHAAQAIDQYSRYLGPTPKFIEQVYCLTPLAGPDGTTTVLLKNAAADRGVSISYSLAQLPCFTLWKNTSLEADGYVTGLEPGTNFPNDRGTEREAGRLGKLQPGQSHQCGLHFALQRTRGEVQEVVKHIAGLQGSRRPQVDLEPGK